MLMFNAMNSGQWLFHLHRILHTYSAHQQKKKNSMGGKNCYVCWWIGTQTLTLVLGLTVAKTIAFDNATFRKVSSSSIAKNQPRYMTLSDPWLEGRSLCNSISLLIHWCPHNSQGTTTPLPSWHRSDDLYIRLWDQKGCFEIPSLPCQEGVASIAMQTKCPIPLRLFFLLILHFSQVHRLSRGISGFNVLPPLNSSPSPAFANWWKPLANVQAERQMIQKRASLLRTFSAGEGTYALDPLSPGSAETGPDGFVLVKRFSATDALQSYASQAAAAYEKVDSPPYSPPPTPPPQTPLSNWHHTQFTTDFQWWPEMR